MTILATRADLFPENETVIDLQLKQGGPSSTYASLSGCRVDVVKLLLRYNAQIDLQNITGRSSLMFASL